MMNSEDPDDIDEEEEMTSRSLSRFLIKKQWPCLKNVLSGFDIKQKLRLEIHQHL